MLFRRPQDLGPLLRDGRARVGWSQTRLAEELGVSRQWISLVETGKTSVEFDLAFSALQALGYHLRVERADPPRPEPPTPSRSRRTPLTREGEPLGKPRSRRARREP
ncbi:MAG: helix-turn-helix domain-containing protein [Gemmatimonadota bacterium]